MILPIVTFPHKALRDKTEPVTFPLSKEIKKLTKDMLDTVKQAEGVGLAAPQVNHLVRMVVINLEHLGVPPFALYNPKIKQSFKEKEEVQEGCLSIPGVFGMVSRPKKVVIEAQNSQGELVTITDDGWIARVAQHEIDHINGVLIIDKIKNYVEGQELVKEWKKQKLI